ncbi:MAG: methylated-DNA--[protein]-cysteine S-methyltransferase [Clostridiales Family XIII bacterium]|jgi:methylated-DNA-[protein]-cysteine S-methyltransferase|nr:methylated-DNA--[protein]-cysteine S-methyltransferase [Clostridiales Family XIII bacterium]
MNVVNTGIKGYVCEFFSPIGNLILVSDGKALTGLYLNKKAMFENNSSNAVLDETLPVFLKVKKWLEAYFLGKNLKINFPIKLCGSEFRRKVWAILKTVPYGETTTYGEIAMKIKKQKGGKAMAAQAVGGALNHNPISIVIPCHRVIGKNGSLVGYGSGLSIKKKLLEIEGIDIKKFDK